MITFFTLMGVFGVLMIGLDLVGFVTDPTPSQYRWGLAGMGALVAAVGFVGAALVAYAP